MIEFKNDVDESGPDLGNQKIEEGESGFVIAQTALLLIPLMLFAAFATDIGFWYLQGQKAQRAADAASLAGVVHLPDVAMAEQEARATAARNGYLDATPGDNSDFDSGPLPQIRVTIPNSESIEVEIKTAEGAFFGRLVLDSIVVERYSIAEYIQPVHMGNPTSGLGTGTIPEAQLGLPNDQMWLAATAYCQDKEQGDHFLTGYHDGPDFYHGPPHEPVWSPTGSQRTCGPAAGQVDPASRVNPNFDADAYVFVVEVQPGSGPIDIDIFDPGTTCSAPPTGTGDISDTRPRLDIEVYGPSTTLNHRQFIQSNAPISHVLPARNACGWNALLNAVPAPSALGGYYYIRVATRNPFITDLAPGDSFWAEASLNRYALRATAAGATTLCAFSAANPTCPQIYALEWLPLYREIPASQEAFYLAEIDEDHAGERLLVTFFDAAENIDNIQFEDSNGNAMPFQWKYVDDSVGGMAAAPGGMQYLETDWVNHSSTCNWQATAGNPCLDTSNRDNFNDHMVQIGIDIPDGYTCGADCWWKIRYNTAAAPTDRSGWAIQLLGDPVRLVE